MGPGEAGGLCACGAEAGGTQGRGTSGSKGAEKMGLLKTRWGWFIHTLHKQFIQEAEGTGWESDGGVLNAKPHRHSPRATARFEGYWKVQKSSHNQGQWLEKPAVGGEDWAGEVMLSFVSPASRRPLSILGPEGDSGPLPCCHHRRTGCLSPSPEACTGLEIFTSQFL